MNFVTPWMNGWPIQKIVIEARIRLMMLKMPMGIGRFGMKPMVLAAISQSMRIKVNRAIGRMN